MSRLGGQFPLPFQGAQSGDGAISLPAGAAYVLPAGNYVVHVSLGLASAVRAVNGDVDFASSLVNQVAQMGQPLYRKQEPTGYSNSGGEWLNSAGLLARMNFALNLAGNKIPGVKVGQVDDLSSFASPDFQRH